MATGKTCGETMEAADVIETPRALPSTVPWFEASPAALCQDVPNAVISQIAVSRTGDIIVAGAGGRGDFGAGPLAGGVFVASFGAHGEPRWSRDLGAGTFLSIAVDGAGNVGVARALVGAINEPGPGVILVDQLDASGRLAWTRNFTSADGKEHGGVSIGSDAEGRWNVAVPGRLFQFDSAGNTLFQIDYDYFVPVSVIPGETGGRILTGFSAPIQMQPSPRAFVAELDTNGTERWRVPLEGGLVAGYGYLQSAGAGSTFVGSTFAERVVVGPSTLEAPSDGSPVPMGVFLTKIGGDGAVAWVQNLARAGETGLVSLAVDECANPLVAFTAADGVSIAALDSAGRRTWTRRFSGLTDAKVLVAPVPGSTDVVLAGSTDVSSCADACPCYQPHPFLYRLKRDGTLADGFVAHR
ncbi:hypothetical protein AKJ09_02414 [Labilithrix luteola]|uniref:Cell surface protein n=1 Tax=Labilithrix luteola TaxID=1391654 RepID=A0A0K1PQD4_9BACT|nr:hypothetical protein AKJ09_02414 [Labilithrix luteola]